MASGKLYQTGRPDHRVLQRRVHTVRQVRLVTIRQVSRGVGLVRSPGCTIMDAR